MFFSFLERAEKWEKPDLFETFIATSLRYRNFSKIFRILTEVEAMTLSKGSEATLEFSASNDPRIHAISFHGPFCVSAFRIRFVSFPQRIFLIQLHFTASIFVVTESFLWTRTLNLICPIPTLVPFPFFLFALRSYSRYSYVKKLTFQFIFQDSDITCWRN